MKPRPIDTVHPEIDDDKRIRIFRGVQCAAPIGPGTQFWHHPLGACTALAAPDESGAFRASYVQHLADGTPQEVVVVFHVEMLSR